MRATLGPLELSQSPLRYFLCAYDHAISGVLTSLDDARFEDPAWVVEFDITFAWLYLDALEAYRADPLRAPRPWQEAFSADPALPAEVHMLLALSVHLNYDLPLALLEVITDAEFEQPAVMARRHRDLERMEAMLADRVRYESGDSRPVSSSRRLLASVFIPANRLAILRFLRDARCTVWQNALDLQRARLAGPEAFERRRAELEASGMAAVADLILPGQARLRRVTAGFGALLPRSHLSRPVGRTLPAPPRRSHTRPAGWSRAGS
jgi:hypothetical protein